MYIYVCVCITNGHCRLLYCLWLRRHSLKRRQIERFYWETAIPTLPIAISLEVNPLWRRALLLLDINVVQHVVDEADNLLSKATILFAAHLLQIRMQTDQKRVIRIGRGNCSSSASSSSCAC